MMMKPNKLGKISVVCGMLFITACTSNTQKPEESASRQQEIQSCKDNLPASKRIKRESITFGCLATLAFWKSIGQENPAALICAAGGGAGFLLGESVAERKCEYLDLASQLDGEIAHAGKLNSTFGLFFLEQESNLKLQQAKAEALTSQTQQKTTNKTAQESLHKDLASQLEKEKYVLAQLQEERQFKQETINEAKAAHLEQAKTDQLLTEIKVLLKNIKKLRANTQILADINDSISH